MGYENRERPDAKDLKILFGDAMMDLTDLKYLAKQGGSTDDIVKAIDFIRETLKAYHRAAFASEDTPDKD